MSRHVRCLSLDGFVRTSLGRGAGGTAFIALLLSLTALACGGIDEALLLDPVDDAGTETTERAPRATADKGVDGQVLDALAQAKRRWQFAGSSDYSMKVRLSCFCARRPGFDVAVTINDGEVVSAIGNSGEGAYDVHIEPDAFREWYTVPGMFERIESNLATTDNLEAVYDSYHGYPMLLAFDYTLASADEEEFFEVWDFVPGKGGAAVDAQQTVPASELLTHR